MYKRLILLVTGFITIFSLNAQKQQVNDSINVNKLEEVIISGTKTIKNTGNSTEITYTDNISSSISIQNKNGFSIPLFFFRDFYIENDVTFNFNVNFDQSQTLTSSFIVDSEEDFNEQASSSNIIVKPDITYKFSRWVNGTIFYSYGISDNKTTGKKKEQDFGFVINIKITG